MDFYYDECKELTSPHHPSSSYTTSPGSDMTSSESTPNLPRSSYATHVRAKSLNYQQHFLSRDSVAATDNFGSGCAPQSCSYYVLVSLSRSTALFRPVDESSTCTALQLATTR